jgi:hypothetical protein
MSDARAVATPAVTEQTSNAGDATDFLIARGGPFYEVQSRLNLLHRHNLAAGRRAALYAAIAWLPLALLSFVQGTAIGEFEERPFLLDFSAYTRFLLAVVIFVLMEPLAERRLQRLASYFVESGLVTRQQLPAAAAAFVKALQRRDSRTAELVALVIAYALSYAMIRANQTIAPQSWLSALQDGAVHLSLAGWWCLLISAPLFLFLLARWIWRFVVWGLLLGDLAKLDLQLAAMHPDRTGGLAFISEYPPVFSAFVFALSSVFAAAAAKAILHAHMDFHIFLYVMAAWLVLIIVLFVLPLTAFMRPLGEFKKRTLLESSALAERANRAIEQRWLGHAREQKDAPAPADSPSRSDLATVYEAARKMKSLPLSKASVLPLAIAVLVPMVGVGATQLPIKEVFKFASRLLI